MVDMTPLAWVEKCFEFPARDGVQWEFKQKQKEVINELAPNYAAGLWLEMAVGKTAISTAIALYHLLAENGKCVCLMPPILVEQWAVWLRSIKPRFGPALKVLEYAGTPKQRKEMNPLDYHFVVMSREIFRRDFSRLSEVYKGSNYTLIVDEAHFIANVETDIHKKTYDFSVGHPSMLLTGTPANKPTDAYGLLRFTNPGAYRSYNYFLNVHVDKVDFFGKPQSWRDLPTIYRHLEKNSKRVLFREVFDATDPPMVELVKYSLDPEHYKRYCKLAEEGVLELESGGKIDGNSSNTLIHDIARSVLDKARVTEKPGDVSAGIEYLQDYLEQLGHNKLVVFAKYTDTVEMMLRHFPKAVAVNGDVSPALKQANIKAFVENPDVGPIIINPQAAGFGIDGLQYVCHHAIWAEATTSPRDFHQANARLDRPGQKSRVVIKVMEAKGTGQIKDVSNLMSNDALVGKVIRNGADLRAYLFGQE